MFPTARTHPCFPMPNLRLVIAVTAALFGSIAHALTVRPPTFEELVAQSETIVRAEATGSRCEWWDSPRGRMIVTYVKFRVDTALKGAAGGGFELRQLGGQMGEERMVIEGLPQFGAGDRDYLFFAGNGRMMCPLVAIPHGRYPVVRDAASQTDFVARADGTPLTAVGDVARSLSETGARPVLEQMKQAPMRASEFEAAIRTELKRQAAASAR